MADIMSYNIKLEVDCSDKDEFIKVLEQLALVQTKQKIKIEFTTDSF